MSVSLASFARASSAVISCTPGSVFGEHAVLLDQPHKPADLLVQQSTKVELFLNLKTAKVLGITVPLPLSGRADEIFE